MKGYPIIHLTDICQPKQWATISLSEMKEEGYPVYGANGKIGFYDKYTHDKETVLVTCRGATCGSLNICEPFSYVNGNAMALDNVDESKIKYKFLYYVLLGRGLNDTITGSAQPQITRAALTKVTFPLPPLSEQERIVRLLDKAEALRGTRERANVRMEQFVPAVFQEMFGNIKWNKAKVLDITEKRNGAIRTGPFGSQLRHSEFVSEGVPVIGIENIVTNSFQWTRARCLPPEKYENFKRYRIFPGDVIVTIMGTVGRVCVAPDDLPECMSTKHLCVISTNKDVIDPHFLWASFLFDQDIRRQTNLVAKGAIMEGWNATIIKQLSISTPHISLQREFAARVEAARGVQSAQGKSSEKIEAVYQSMLSRAFAGEL